MSTYKLTYFNAKGIAESIRMLLSYSGKEFKDIRIEHNDWLKNVKSSKFLIIISILIYSCDASKKLRRQQDGLLYSSEIVDNHLLNGGKSEFS